MDTYYKDPDAKKPYTVNWAARLGADTISTSTWIVPAGLTASSPSNTTTVATTWLQGGVVGESYDVTNRITSAAGIIDDFTFRIVIQQQ